MKRKYENQDSITVSQDSYLGGLCFTAFVEQGTCGPNYSLEGLSIKVSWDLCNEIITIDFYDMTCYPPKGTKTHKLMLEYIEGKVKGN